MLCAGTNTAPAVCRLCSGARKCRAALCALRQAAPSTAVASAPPPPPPAPPRPPQISVGPGGQVGFATPSGFSLRTSAIGSILAAAWANASTALVWDYAFQLTNAASASSSSASGDTVKVWSMEARQFCR
jgi:hypothetical protein